MGQALFEQQQIDEMKDKVKDYLNIKNSSQIRFADNDDLEILCIPPWVIERLNVEIDHFHNAASFVEMPEKIIKNYCKFKLDLFAT